MGYPLNFGVADKPIYFWMFDSSDHRSGKTGLSPTVKIKKNGVAAGTPAGAVSEVDSTNMPGLYQIAAHLTDVNTLGPLSLNATATGADASSDVFDVQRPKWELNFDEAFTSTAGTTVRGIAGLTQHGEFVNVYTIDPTATCALAVREHGSGSDLYTIAATTVNAAGVFELEKASPGYTADRVYKYTFTVIINGVTRTFIHTRPVQG